MPVDEKRLLRPVIIMGIAAESEDEVGVVGMTESEAREAREDSIPPLFPWWWKW